MIGSYAPEDVTLLLTELPDAGLELPADVRARLLREGGHYAETLPIEYRPTPEYESLFERLLASHAPRVALLTAVLAERIVEEQHPSPVLVSLARAGTPVGVVLRRALAARGVDAPHYSVSIVRGRGIDRRALEHIVERHGPEPLVFIDGWTGKGAIMRELREALEAVALEGGPRIAPALGVLADTGHVCELFASRADELIPSACLNSTVSGLISRTVIRPDLLGEDAFHGVRVYREFADRDVSRRYVDTITALLPSPGPSLDAAVAAARAEGPPDGRGWQAVLAVGREHGIDDIHRIKPGVGETTRVLLRRVPDAVLVSPGHEADLAHILMLAEQRGVPVRERPDDVYACYGLIKP
jgi:hypothetical protein